MKTVGLANIGVLGNNRSRAAIFYSARTLPQDHARLRPTCQRGVIVSRCNLEVIKAADVLQNFFAGRVP